jgi:rod shape-determining protein MreC
MQQILNFFFKNRTTILFLILFLVAFAITTQSHDYHNSKFLNSSNQISGSLHEVFSSIGNYFNLKKENKLLLEENNRLKSNIFNSKIKIVDSFEIEKKFKLTPTLVNKNSYRYLENYITINIGELDGIKEDFGVITSKGIVGIIDQTSSKYARVLSILNIKSKINAKLKQSNHFGTLGWDGVNSNTVQLNDIQDLAEITVGDTIVTSGFSYIFPENIPIGEVESYKLNYTKDLFIINVRLFNDMTNLRHVHVIENLNIDELQILNPANE